MLTDFNKNIELLTPQDVADLLQISVKTVYAHAKKLGGFYPLGIQVLRFRAEEIYERLEGTGRISLSLPVQRDQIQRERIQNAERSKSGRGRAKKGSGIAAKEDGDRHGLFRYCQTVS